MLNKNDPLIGAVQEVMKRNQAERDATKLVNEKFGITDRKALPREKQGDWDAAYKTVLTEGAEALDEISANLVARAAKKAERKADAAADDNLHVQAKAYGDQAERLWDKSEKKRSAEIRKKDIAGLSSGKKRAYQKRYGKLKEEALDEIKRSTASRAQKRAEHLAKNPQEEDDSPDAPGRVTDRAAQAANIKRMRIKKLQKEEALDELKGITSNTGARAGYMLKGIGSAIGAKLKGDKKTYVKRIKGLEGAKKKSEADTEKRKQDVYNNEMARKVLKDMGRKTGYGNIYDKMFEEEALDEAEYKPTAGSDDPGYMGFMKAVHKDAKTMTPKKFAKEYPEIAKHQKTIANTPRKNVHRLSVNNNTGKVYLKVEEEMTAAQKKAHDIAKSIMKKKLEEGFNNRHDLSVTASVEEQVVAEVTMGGSAPAIAQRTIGGSQRFRPRGAPTSSMRVNARSPVSQRPGINAATGSLQPTDTQRGAGYRITDVRDTAYGANPTDKKLGPASSTGGSGVPPVPTPKQAAPYSTTPRPSPSFERTGRGGSPSLAPRPSPSFERTGRGGSPSLAQKAPVSTVGRDRPGIGPGQGPGVPSGPENIKMSTQKAADDFKFTEKERAGKVSAERLKQFYQQKGLTQSGKMTQDLRTFMNAAKNKTLNTKVTPATELQKANQARLQAGRTTTTSSVAGGQGVAALPSGPVKSTAPVPTARPASVGSAGPARPTMATNAQAAGQMAVDRMRAQNLAKSQTPSMSAGMSSQTPSSVSSQRQSTGDIAPPRATQQQSNSIRRDVIRTNAGMPLPPRPVNPSTSGR